MPHFRISIVIAMLLGAASCSGPELPMPFSELREVETLPDEDARYPYLHTAGDSVLVSWQSDREDYTELHIAGMQGNQLSGSTRITHGPDWFVNWADFPVIGSTREGSVVLNFMTSSGPGTFAYDVNFISRVAGEWGEPFVPHTDGTPTEHGFASFEPLGDDQLLAIWLDGRNMHDPQQQTGEGHGSGDMMLMQAKVDPAEGVLEKGPLDQRVCECCPTASAQTSRAAVFFYRDRSADETRNISTVRYDIEEQNWEQTGNVHDDEWQIRGCPVNGPAADSYNETIGVAWYTAPADQPSVRLAFSTDHGQSYSSPVEIQTGHALGRVDIIMIDSETALVTWIEREDGEHRLMARLTDRDGRKGEAQVLANSESLASRSAGFPRMTRLGDTVYLGWTEPGPPHSLRLIRGRLSGM